MHANCRDRRGRAAGCRPDALVAEHVGTYCVEIRPERRARNSVLDRLNVLDCTWEEVGDTLYVYPEHQLPLDALATLPHERLVHRPASLEDLFQRLTGRELDG